MEEDVTAEVAGTWEEEVMVVEASKSQRKLFSGSRFEEQRAEAEAEEHGEGRQETVV